MDAVKVLLENNDEEVLVIGSNAITMPFVDDKGEEKWLKIVFSIPKGSKDEEFDGYSLAEDWEQKQLLKAQKEEEKKKKAEEEKKKKEKERA